MKDAGKVDQRLNGKTKWIIGLLSLIQGMLLAGGGYWVGQTRSNTAHLVEHRLQDRHKGSGDLATQVNLQARMATVEQAVIDIRNDIREIRNVLVKQARPAREDR